MSDGQKSSVESDEAFQAALEKVYEEMEARIEQTRSTEMLTADDYKIVINCVAP